MNEAKAEQWIYRLLCGFALSLSLSVFMGNVFLALLAPLFLYILHKRRGTLRESANISPMVYAPVLCFCAVSFASMLASGHPTEGIRLFLNLFLFRPLPCFLVLLAIHEKEKIWRLAVLLGCSIFLNDAVSITRAAWNGFTTGRDFGLIGFMDQASLLAAAIPLLSLALMKLPAGRDRSFAFLALATAIPALLFTRTRGGWIAALVATAVSVFLASESIKKFAAGSMVVLAILTGIFVSVPAFGHRLATIPRTDNQSNAERLLMWQSACNMFSDHPLLGVGLGQYAKEYHARYILPQQKERDHNHAHSNFFHILGERGGLGALSFLVLWGSFTYYGIHGWRKYKDIAYLAFFAIVTSILVHGLVDYNLGWAIVSKFFWFALALCLKWISLTGEGV